MPVTRLPQENRVKKSLDEIIEKVRKLLALATSPNEHEAALAAQRAHEYLVKYNLDMQTIKDRPQSAYGETVVDKRVFRKTEEKFVDNLLVRHFFVKIYTFRQMGPLWRRNNSKSTWYETHTVLVGTKANVEIASYIRAFLLTKFRQLWLEHLKTNAPYVRPREEQSYYTGLCRGLSEKLEAQKSRVEQQYGLVLVADRELDVFLAAKGLVQKKSRTFDVSADTIEAGIDAGKKIEIRRGITADSKKSQAALPGAKK